MLRSLNSIVRSQAAMPSGSSNRRTTTQLGLGGAVRRVHGSLGHHGPDLDQSECRKPEHVQQHDARALAASASA